MDVKHCAKIDTNDKNSYRPSCDSLVAPRTKGPSMDRYELDRRYQADLNRNVEDYVADTDDSICDDDECCDVCERTACDGATLSVWYERDNGTNAVICDDCRASNPANEIGGAA